MRKFKVNTESMANTYRVSKAEIEALRTELEDMRTSVTELNNTWVGSNSTNFSNDFRQACEKMEKLIAVLDSYVETYSKAADIYDSCESEVSGLASF